MGRGLTLDTGALIALESRRMRMRQRLQLATDGGVTITVPSAVIAEWWRGRTDVREELLASVSVEPLAESVARAAGEALASLGGSNAVDAIVMASAAQRGDVVYTSDVGDLTRLSEYFRSVKVLGV